MKRLIAAIIILLIICALCILNIPKETLSTTIGTSSNTEIKETTTTTKVKTTKKVVKQKTTEKVNDDSYKITHYGYDCKGCSGTTVSGYNVKNNIYYNDKTYGKIRIIAFNKLPLYSIIKINDYRGTEIIAIVLDRGTNHIDLLVSNEKEARKLGVARSTIEVLRQGK